MAIKSKQLEQEIGNIETVMPYLLDRLDAKIADLPEPVRKGLRRVKLAPKLTSSGLESVRSLADWLTYARSLALDYREGKLDLTSLTKR